MALFAADVRRVERAGLNGWPAETQLLVGGWVARLGDGYTKRANSVTALAKHSGVLSDDVAYCESLYLARGLTPIFRLSENSSPPKLDAYLAERGYGVVDPTLVLTRSVGDANWPESIEDCDDVSRWLAAYGRLTGASDDSLSAHRALLDRIALPTAYLLARDALGRAAGCLLAVQDREWVGVFDLIVDSACRRKGYGRALMVALLAWARDQGAEACFLQVVEANAAARAFYENLGYRYAYRYWYRIPGKRG